ncbi:unnamed protein product [Cylicostephanus goldi]|uniref:Uncharacterized protein n=1 Tax=Cylicostephanus goldi TaxID=71465 RepID=A0A3P6Q2X1_CYLGO|nr:unnamed protein product [Cylicostephanus goldi]
MSPSIHDDLQPRCMSVAGARTVYDFLISAQLRNNKCIIPSSRGDSGSTLQKPRASRMSPASTSMHLLRVVISLIFTPYGQDALLQQQLQQQQQAAAQANTQSPSSQLVSHLLATALLGGSNPLAVNQMASGGSSSTVEPQGMQLLSVLQNQLAFGQLLPQFQSGQNLGAINPLLNPAIALYYQQLLQQQQQQQTLLQQLAQQQIPQAQAVQVPQAHAFQPPAQVSSGNVESQLSAQERLMSAYLSEQQQQQAGTFSISNRDQESTLLNHQVASGGHAQHVQHHHDRASVGTTRSLGAVASGSADMESAEERINRLISENEAIVQPHQVSILVHLFAA